MDIYRAAERRSKYLTLVTDTEGDDCLVFAQSVNIYENFSFKCSKIAKNASYLKTAHVPSRMNAKIQSERA